MKYFIFYISLFSSAVSSAQMQKNWDAFAQKIDVTSYQGKKFRFQAAVKVLSKDPSSQAEIWARIDKSDNKMGFFYNMVDKPIRLNEWKIYSIEGKVDKGAKVLNIGGLYFENGIFSFDDFKLDIEIKKGQWLSIPLIDAGFEDDVDSVNNKWYFFHNTKGFTKSISLDSASEGRKFLKIIGENFKPEVQYGNNLSVGKYADVNGIKLYYEIYGEGAPLLLLHGNRSPIETFYKQIPELSKHFKVIAVDTRGQGKSTEDGKTYTYDLFAEDMNAFLDYLHLDSVNILGWSDGGNTGLIMAMKYPDKVRRLVTMGADVFIDTTVVAPWVFKEVENQLKEFSKDTSYASRNNWRLANLLITEPKHTFNDLKQIKCPVLVMAGQNDIIKENHTKGIAANIPNSELFIAPNQTHYFPQENPALFNKMVIDFFTKNLQSP